MFQKLAEEGHLLTIYSIKQTWILYFDTERLVVKFGCSLYLVYHTILSLVRRCVFSLTRYWVASELKRLANISLWCLPTMLATASIIICPLPRYVEHRVTLLIATNKVPEATIKALTQEINASPLLQTPSNASAQWQSAVLPVSPLISAALLCQYTDCLPSTWKMHRLTHFSTETGAAPSPGAKSVEPGTANRDLHRMCRTPENDRIHCMLIAYITVGGSRTSGCVGPER